MEFKFWNFYIAIHLYDKLDVREQMRTRRQIAAMKLSFNISYLVFIVSFATDKKAKIYRYSVMKLKPYIKWLSG